MHQKLYNGARLLGEGASQHNVNLIDQGAAPMIAHMCMTGMSVDLDHFAKMEKELAIDMDRITEEVKTETGYYINLNSPDQVADLLFKKMGLKQARRKFTPTNKRESVDDEVLTAVQHVHPVVPKIQDHREYSKLLGTYVQPMSKLAVRTAFGEYRMFPNLGHTRVPSGRLNCKEPNLLAMPTRTERGRDIRRGFRARPGWKIVSVDESQIEPRLAAHTSKDPALCNVYFKEEDIYSDFATGAFRLTDKRYLAKGDEAKRLLAKRKPAWVYPTVDSLLHRRPAKTCVLAALYDVSPGGLLDQMPVVCKNCGTEASKHSKACLQFQSLWTENGCADLLNAFYLKYPGVIEDRKKNHRNARRYGYIWDMWGRILHVAAVRSVLPWVVSAALREVGNFVYQSGAQGTIKLVMAQLYDEFEEAGFWGDIVNPLLQIHDELLLEVREDCVEDIYTHTVFRFENCVRLHIPIKAGYAYADTWGDLEK